MDNIKKKIKKSDSYSVKHCLQPFQNQDGLIQMMMNLSAKIFTFDFVVSDVK